MDTVKFDKKSTLVVAHRGLSGIEPENTNASFIAAGNRSYYGIETDIQFTGDNKIICFHDKTAKRLIGENIRINCCRLKDLLKKEFIKRAHIDGQNIAVF